MCTSVYTGYSLDFKPGAEFLRVLFTTNNLPQNNFAVYGPPRQNDSKLSGLSDFET